MKMSHNKKKNTMLLYEILIRELTKSVLEDNKEKKEKITFTLKKYFSKDKPLAKEMELYKILSQTNGLKERTARRLLSEVARVYNNFNLGKISQEQEEVVSKMKEDTHKDVFLTYVPNYKNLATIYQLFNKKLNPKERIILEEKIIESLISQSKEEEEKEIKPTSNLVFKSFVKVFNEEYSGTLLKEQQELLSRYVMSNVDNNVELRIYLNEEIGRIKEVLNNAIKKDDIIKDDKEAIQKINEVMGVLEKFKEEPKIEGELLEQLLRIQSLTKEIEGN